jgi:hemerythrin superfamily protein
MPSKNSSATFTKINAVDLLKKDHAAVRELLGQLAETKPRAAQKRARLFAKIDQELKTHKSIEEEIFYPAYHEAARTQADAKLFFEAAEEHGLVDIVLGALEAADPASEEYGAKCKVLKDLVEHHAEEEEKEMFPRAKKLLGKKHLEELGAEMQARKDELLTGYLTTERKVRNGRVRSTSLDQWR